MNGSRAILGNGLFSKYYGDKAINTNQVTHLNVS